MTDNLTAINHNGQWVVDSREVAEIVGKSHSNLCRDIEVYNSILRDSQNLNLSSDEFFVESRYIAGKGNGCKYSLKIIYGDEQ